MVMILAAGVCVADETYLNGKKKSEYSADGKQQIIRRDYFDGGGLKEITPFVAVGPIPERDAVPNGLRQQYNEEGKLLSEQTFKNGKLEGLSRFYSPPGTLHLIERYADGVLETRSEYDPAGRLTASTEFYADGSRKGETGLAPEVILNEMKPEKLRYKNGVKQGEHVEYYGNGGIKFEGNYEGGLYEGAYKSFYPNGLLSQSGNFVRGSKEGPEIGYFKNNRLEYRKFYRRGKLHGKNQFYFADGAVKWEAEFSDGRLHGSAVCFFRENKGREVVQFEKGVRRSSKGYDATGALIWQESRYDDGSLKALGPGDSPRVGTLENRHCTLDPV